uniref:soluble guanylate cyclase gcy-31-like n=1 Tax=Styela clava TaxID=7725 RepID=UPI00193A078C|nr:soluble guanylate cyclase gcy-31-like [Styela clava]
MYGIILDSMTDCIKQLYGEEVWKSVVGSTDISNTVFVTHKIYDEQLIPMIANAVVEITGNDICTIMEQAGRHFIDYIDDIRNDRIAKVLGRTFKDFLNGLDCMHEYYRLTFPELQPPSFIVEREDENGLELHYRSRRTFTGFMHYVKGILLEIAKNFFSMEVKVEITQQGFSGDVLCAVYRLDFRNEEYISRQEKIQRKRKLRKENSLNFPSHVVFELFPYHIVFDERLTIQSTGHGLDELYSGLQGKRINETFFMTRPLGYDLTWENVIIHGNNVFELTSVKAAGRRRKTDNSSGFRHQMATNHFIKLRGQMLYVEEWNFVIFLSTLMLDGLNTLYEMGIYVNDLTFHDLSRDLVLHGPQQTTEYKLALDLEQGKKTRLEEMIETLGTERRRTDDLLYSMIPKKIATSLRHGNTTVSLCEKYDDVTVLFSDIVNFACISKHIAPHEIMIILNMMVSVFDILCDKFDIYKVETIADGFMAVSGAPTYNKYHARNMADMAFEMLKGIKTVKDPNTRDPIEIRIGLHCGDVIAGLVGHKIPRYCLFGNTVNIASKMEATGEGMRIQISQTCKDNLDQYGGIYIVEDKGYVDIKGCGDIMTYWLNGKTEDEKFDYISDAGRREFYGEDEGEPDDEVEGDDADYEEEEEEGQNGEEEEGKDEKAKEEEEFDEESDASAPSADIEKEDNDTEVETQTITGSQQSNPANGKKGSESNSSTEGKSSIDRSDEPRPFQKLPQLLKPPKRKPGRDFASNRVPEIRKLYPQNSSMFGTRSTLGAKK